MMSVISLMDSDTANNLNSFPNLMDGALQVLGCPEPGKKVSLSRELAELWRSGSLPAGLSEHGNRQFSPPDRPARPDKPDLLLPRNMPKRKPGGKKGLIALLHALAHIELNAIDLAWDIIVRFAPSVRKISDHATLQDFCSDWVSVADDEAFHFSLLTGRLAAQNACYGDLPAHDGLWEAAISTKNDLMARLALVPMVLEARGLDVTPATMARLQRVSLPDEAVVLEQIYKDEIRHVGFGVKWFEFMATRMNIDPHVTWRALVDQHFSGQLQGPYNKEARLEAGFSGEYYESGPS